MSLLGLKYHTGTDTIELQSSRAGCAATAPNPHLKRHVLKVHCREAHYDRSFCRNIHLMSDLGRCTSIVVLFLLPLLLLLLLLKPESCALTEKLLRCRVSFGNAGF